MRSNGLHSSTAISQGTQKGGAFSLIELLAVIAVMSLLISLAVPVMSGLQSSGKMNDAVTRVSLMLDQARDYAMAHNSYVWVGFKEADDDGGVQVSAVAGTTGMSTDIGSAGTLRQISKVELFDRIKYRNGSGDLSGMETANNVSESKIGTFNQSKQGKTIQFNHIVQFSPSGEARVGVDQPKRWIEVGFQPSVGDATNGDVAALQISATSGQVRIFRP